MSPGCLVTGQRLACQSRLIDAEIFALGQDQIGGKDLAGIHADDVTRNEVRRLDHRPAAVAQHARLVGQALLQRRKRACGLVVLPEADRSVIQEQAHDNAEVRPVLPG